MIVKDNVIKNKLIKVLNIALGEEIVEVSYEIEKLKGGTVGDVMLIYGEAKTMGSKEIPYKVVYKIQKKWDRYGDANSWRREYDLYRENLDSLFSDSFRWPKCYYAELLEDETHIWMEYIEGVSGTDLTPDMYEKAAEKLGEFQGNLYANKPEILYNFSNLSTKNYIKNSYLHYKSWKEVYDYIRSNECEIPKHLCQMITDIDEKSNEIWESIEKLPLVFCHRDFWNENIFYKDDKIVLLDWDTSGWGYLGEDIASLIADESDVNHMIEYYERSVKSYYKGFSRYVDISNIKLPYIKELIIFMFGYRLVEGFKFAETEEEKQIQIHILNKIYEMEDINISI